MGNQAEGASLECMCALALETLQEEYIVQMEGVDIDGNDIEVFTDPTGNYFSSDYYVLHAEQNEATQVMELKVDLAVWDGGKVAEGYEEFQNVSLEMSFSNVTEESFDFLENLYSFPVVFSFTISGYEDMEGLCFFCDNIPGFEAG